MLLKTLLALQAAQTGFDTRHVLALNVPVMSYGQTPEQIVRFYKETMRRIARAAGRGPRRPGQLSAVARCGQLRSRASSSRSMAMSRAPGEEDPRGQFRIDLARLLRGARRAADCRTRFQRRSTAVAGAGGHRQPEPGTAHVSESGRASTAT